MRSVRGAIVISTEALILEKINEYNASIGTDNFITLTIPFIISNMVTILLYNI